MINIDQIRDDFPILKQDIHGNPLVYLDNAATTQKPQAVIDCVSEFYSTKNSNIHRGAHYLSEQASAAYESARETVRRFINAEALSEIVFTHGTTDSLNLLADSFGRQFVSPGDEVIVTEMEHHSNIVPWQMLCERSGATLRFIPVQPDGALDLESLDSLITDRTKLVSITHVSNVLGIINPIERVIEIAHARGVPVAIDGAQSAQHFRLDVQKLDCDFLVLSGHKLYAETGIGVLYGKQRWMDEMPPSRFGGGMVDHVKLENTTFAESPLKFEAGTGNFVGAASLAAAIEYVEGVGLDDLGDHENSVYGYAIDQLRSLDGVTIYGDNSRRCASIAFNVDNVHPSDAGQILDKMGIAVRAGLHCAEPLMKRLGLDGTLRASFGLYNTTGDVDRLVGGVQKVQQMMCQVKS